MNNDNYTRFQYNMIYRYWCFNQLILSFDHIDDVILVVKKKLYQILKMRRFNIPKLSELNSGLCYDDPMDSYMFINTDGIVFVSRDPGDIFIKFEWVSISYHSTRNDSFAITICYMTKSGKRSFYIHTGLSHIDVNNLTCDNQIISSDKHYFSERYIDGKIYHHPVFIAF